MQARAAPVPLLSDLVGKEERVLGLLCLREQRVMVTSLLVSMGVTADTTSAPAARAGRHASRAMRGAHD